MSEEEEHPKGILKHSSTDEKKSKTFQWDEMNILATYHPADKTYGHMKVDEPPTPYNFEYTNSQAADQGISPEALASKLAEVTNEPPKMLVTKKHDADAVMTPEEIEHRRKFEEKRKRHYNEYQAVLALRSSHGSGAEEDEEDDEDYVDPIAARNAKINSQLNSRPPPKF